MGGKKTTKSSTAQTQTATPWAPVVPGMSQAAAGITDAMNQVAARPAYTGDFVAQPGAMMQSVPDLYAYAAKQAQGLGQQAQGVINNQLFTMPTFGDSPDLATAMSSYANSNPGGMDAAIAASTKPYIQQLMQQVLPSLQSAGIESGAYGGSRAQQTLPGMAISDTNQQAMDLAAKMGYQDYTDTAERMLQGYGLSTERGLGVGDTMTARLAQYPELMDAVMRMTGGAAELTREGGTVQTGISQAAIDNALAKEQYAVQQPFQGYDTATDLLTRLSQGYGTTNMTGTTKTTEKTGGAAPWVQGALGVASMLAAIPTGGASMAGAMGGGTLGSSLVSSLFGKKPGG